MADKPKTEKPDVRTQRLVVYITEADSEELFRIAGLLRMPRSSLVAAILERMIIGGFSPLVGAKVCHQIHKRLEQYGVPAKGFYFGIRPLPPLPDEELSKRESTELLAQIKQEMKPC